MDKLKKVVRREKDEKTEEDGILERANEASSLSCGTRVKAFAFCFFLGILFSFLRATLSMLTLVLSNTPSFLAFHIYGNNLLLWLSVSMVTAFFLVTAPMGVAMLWIPGLGIGVFAAFYTAGNVFALLSIMFLVGPCKQLKTMCAVERVFATILMLTFIVLTVFAAFWWKNLVLSLIFCACQFLAFAWFALSYVPFARNGILKCLRCCCTT